MPRHFKLFLFSSLSMEWMKTPPTLSSPMPSPSKERIELDKVYHAISLKPTCSKIRGAFNFRSKLGFCPNRLDPPFPPRMLGLPRRKKNMFFCILGYSKHIIFSCKSHTFGVTDDFLFDFWWFCRLGLGNPRNIATKTPLEKFGGGSPVPTNKITKNHIKNHQSPQKCDFYMKK